MKDLTHTEAVSETRDDGVGFDHRLALVLSANVSEPIDEGSDEDITYRERQLGVDANGACADINRASSPETARSKQPPGALSEQEAKAADDLTPAV